MDFDFNKKIASLPVWAWVVIGVGGIYLFQRFKGKSATAVDTTAETDMSASTEPSTPYGNTSEPFQQIPDLPTTATTSPTPRPTTTPGYRGGALPPRVVKKPVVKKPVVKKPVVKKPVVKKPVVKKPAHHAQHKSRQTSRPATPHAPATREATPHTFTRDPNGVIQPFIQHYGSASTSAAVVPHYEAGTT
jgi:cytoskeletal protein RodZ